MLREHLKAHPKDQKKLESLVHPLVIKRVQEILKGVSKGLVALEVPLLYESKMDKMCDFVIGVDISEDKQLERLKKRNPNSALDLMKINASSKFNVNKEKVDYLLLNDSTEKNLEKEVNKVINKLLSHLN